VALMDAGYGTDTDLRTNITALGLSYVAGIQPQRCTPGPMSRKSVSPTRALRR
jgi:hypothetical protein